MGYTWDSDFNSSFSTKTALGYDVSFCKMGIIWKIVWANVQHLKYY